MKVWRTKVWRVYTDYLEFGIDYDTLEAARAAKQAYAATHPALRYFIRCIHNARDH